MTPLTTRAAVRGSTDAAPKRSGNDAGAEVRSAAGAGCRCTRLRSMVVDTTVATSTGSSTAGSAGAAITSAFTGGSSTEGSAGAVITSASTGGSSTAGSSGAGATSAATGGWSRTTSLDAGSARVSVVAVATAAGEKAAAGAADASGSVTTGSRTSSPAGCVSVDSWADGAGASTGGRGGLGGMTRSGGSGGGGPGSGAFLPRRVFFDGRFDLARGGGFLRAGGGGVPAQPARRECPAWAAADERA